MVIVYDKNILYLATKYIQTQHYEHEQVYNISRILPLLLLQAKHWNGLINSKPLVSYIFI